MNKSLLLFFITLFSFTTGIVSAQNSKDLISSPQYLGEPVASEGTSLVKAKDGKLTFIYRKGDWDHGGFSNEIYYQQSDDEGKNWSEENLLVDTPGNVAQCFATISPVSGEVIVFYINRGQGVFCAKSQKDWSEWSFQKMQTEDDAPINTIGYGNSLWVTNGNSMRVISGFHVNDNTGAGSFYSDDDGITWKSSNRAVVPNSVPNIWQTGAVEPSFVELGNGDILMFLRNSNFNIWKSISKDKGASWSKPIKTNIYCGDNSWISLKNLVNGDLLLIWNNAKALRPEVTNDQWSFTSREVLHLAISQDDGNTWQGFRELMLDRLRDSLFVNHPGDKGLNESKVVETSEGNILVACGQAEGHRAFVLLDPAWVTDLERFDDFEKGIAQWSRQKIIKRAPVYNRKYHYNYDRKPGAVLVEHPDNAERKVLHLRRLQDTTVYSQRDGAVWNFAARQAGTLRTRIRLNSGFKGASIVLNDRWFQPIDNQGIETAMYVLEIPSSGRISKDVILDKDQWYDIDLVWSGTDNFETNACLIYVNNQQISTRLMLENRSVYGISYVRFRSGSRVEDTNGMYIEMVHATEN